MLISAVVPSDTIKKHEILYARICPNCKVVFYDAEKDIPLRK